MSSGKGVNGQINAYTYLVRRVKQVCTVGYDNGPHSGVRAPPRCTLSPKPTDLSVWAPDPAGSAPPLQLARRNPDPARAVGEPGKVRLACPPHC